MTDVAIIDIHVYSNQYLFVILMGIMVGYWCVFRDTITQITGRRYTWIEILCIISALYFLPMYTSLLLTGIIGGIIGGYYGKHHYELWQHKNDIQAMGDVIRQHEVETD